MAQLEKSGVGLPRHFPKTAILFLDRLCMFLLSLETHPVLQWMLVGTTFTATASLILQLAMLFIALIECNWHWERNQLLLVCSCLYTTAVTIRAMVYKYGADFAPII